MPFKCVFCVSGRLTAIEAGGLYLIYGFHEMIRGIQPSTRTLKGRLAVNPKLTNASVPHADFMRLPASSTQSTRHESAPSHSADAGSASAAGMKRAYRATAMRHLPSPLGWKSAYLAFLAIVFACLAAVAAVAHHDMPLLIGGF